MNKIRSIFLISLVLILVGCMNKTSDKYEYSVFTTQDVETTLYSLMQQAGIAFPVEGEPGKLRITDIEQAKSQNSMAITLNTAGKKGWELTAINNSQLYIFQRPLGKTKHQPWQYKVLTIADIDKLIFSRLVAQKAAEPVPNQPGKFKILDVQKAKSQVIMAEILNALGKEGWILVGVNKSDLYIFKKKGVGVTSFHKPSKQAQAARKPVTTQSVAPTSSGKTSVQSQAVTDNQATESKAKTETNVAEQTKNADKTDSKDKIDDTKSDLNDKAKNSEDIKKSSNAAQESDTKSDTQKTKASSKKSKAKAATKSNSKHNAKKSESGKKDSKGSK